MPLLQGRTDHGRITSSTLWRQHAGWSAPRGAVSVAGPSDTLFRNEVSGGQRNQWLGTVLLVPRISTTLMTFAAIVAAAAIIALAFLGTYTRKARIEGWLVPQQGMSQIYAPQTGIVTALHVAEGMQVKKGTPLLDLSSDVQSQSVGSTVQEVVDKLKERRDTSKATLAAQNALYDQKASDLKSQIATMQQQRDHLEGQITLQRQRVRVSETSLSATGRCSGTGIISLTRCSNVEQANLEQLGMQQSLQRELSSLDSQIGQVRGSLSEIPMLRNTALGDIERSIASIDQEIAEAEARRETVLQAPQDGVVTALTIEQAAGPSPIHRFSALFPLAPLLKHSCSAPVAPLVLSRKARRFPCATSPSPTRSLAFMAAP